jgi:hypothetical protein
LPFRGSALLLLTVAELSRGIVCGWTETSTVDGGADSAENVVKGNIPMKHSSLLFTLAGLLLIGISLAGLVEVYRKIPQAPAPPSCAALCDEISSQNILTHIVSLSQHPTRALSSQGSERAVEYISGRMRDQGWDVSERTFAAEGRSGVFITNIEAGYPGSGDSDSVLVLCTHYDSRADDPLGHAPGADDNASGAAVLLEVARVLSGIGHLETPLRVKILFFGGEEDSMLGSTHFVEQLAGGRNKIIGAINIDMIGYDAEGPKDFVIFTDSASSGLSRIIESCALRLTPLRYETTLTDYANSDHGPFWSNGLKAVSLWEGYDHNPFYHSSLDTHDKLSPAFMTQIARALLCAVLTLSPAPEPAYLH